MTAARYLSTPFTAKLASDLDAAVADATRSSSFNEYKRLGGLLEAHLKAVDAHVQALAAKR